MATSNDPIDPSTDVIKIDKWSGSIIKNTLDDYLLNLFVTDLKYEQFHKLTNIRLLISFASVLAASYALVWDYFNPFPLSSNVLIVCVLIYFFLMGVLTLYDAFIEKGIFLVTEKGKRRITFSSSLKKYDHEYCLTIQQTENGSSKTTSLTKSVACWIDEEGKLVKDKLRNDIIKFHNMSLKGSVKKHS